MMAKSKTINRSSSRYIYMFILQKLLTYLLIMFGAFTACFILLRFVPGDPLGTLLTSIEQQYGWRLPPEDKARIISEYKRMFGLEGSILEQYILFLRRVIFEGNLGPSLISFPTPAQNLISRALPWTIWLLGISTILSWLIGNILGTLVGWKHGSKTDTVITAVALCLSQIPYYYLALLLVLFVAFTLGILPAMGAYSAELAPSFTPEFILSMLKHTILPASSLVLVSACGWLISMRSLIISIQGEDYLLFAVAKGLKKNYILMKYAFRNAMLPQVTGLAISLGFIVNGAYLVEWIFNYPGIGYLFVTAINLLDFNVIQGILLLTVFTVLTANFIVEILYPILDPRIRYWGK